MEIETEKILKKIRILRKEKGLSIFNLALAVDISHSHLYYIETLRVIPSIDIVMKIAKALRIEVKDFLDYTAESK